MIWKLPKLKQVHLSLKLLSPNPLTIEHIPRKSTQCEQMKLWIKGILKGGGEISIKASPNDNQMFSLEIRYRNKTET